jgi:4-amino-4-deoxy-L-arabinose transferase-like glycosyltransferase
MQRRQEIFRRLLLVAILALGTYLRLHGISFGLPDKFRPDEEYNVSRAVGFQTGNLNPAFFVYPTLYMYVLGVVYFLCGLVGQAVGLIDQGDVGAFFAQHLYGPAHLIARLVTALLGVLGVYAVYLLGRRLAGESVGLLASFITACSFVLVRESHYATNDIPMAVSLTVALFFVLGIFQTAQTKEYFWAGLWAGLASSTKYTAIVLGAPIAVAHFLRAAAYRESVLSRERVAKLSLCAAAMTGAFLLGSPYVLLDLKRFLADWEYQLPFLQHGVGVEMDYGWRWLFQFALRYGMGEWLTFAVVAASLWAAIRCLRSRGRESEGLILASLLLVSGLIFIRSKWLFLRYVAVMVPAAAVLVADGIDRIARHAPKRVAPVIVVALVALLTLEPLTRSIKHNQLLVKTDTRTLAEEWIREHIPNPSKIAADVRFFYAKPQLRRGYEYVAFDSLSNPENQSVRWALVDEHPIRYFSPQPMPQAVETLEARGELAVEFSPFSGTGSEVPVFDVQDAFYVPVAGFSAVERPGSIVRIYKLK